MSGETFDLLVAFTAPRDATCAICDGPIEKGQDMIVAYPQPVHAQCAEDAGESVSW